MLKEFKKFALRGNVTDMAVDIIVGAAYCKIVISLVNDRPAGPARDGGDFSNMFVNLSGAGHQGLPGVPVGCAGYGPAMQILYFPHRLTCREAKTMAQWRLA